MTAMDKIETTAQEVYGTCVCLGLQRAARGVARRYDDALRSTGLTSGQFSILSALLRDKPTPMGALAELLGLDRTTLNRNLQPLETAKLIETLSDPADRRLRKLQLTKAGHKKLALAIPLWRKIQAAECVNEHETADS
jgi:DNA-binding MarR family transcriptional regulator